jgi:PAS domain S-box-containing protein
MTRERRASFRRREDHLRLVINAIPTTVWSVQPDGVVDFINQRYLDYTGLSLERALANPTQAMHPEELPTVMEKWGAAMAAGQPYEGEMRLRRADGEYRWFLVRTEPLRDERGNIVRWYGASIDIEDRKRTADALRQNERELRRGEDRLRMVVDTIPTMAWTVRPDGVVDFLNQRWMDYTGLSLEQYVEEPTGPIHPEDIARVIEKWTADVGAGRPYESEMRLRGADGEYRWFLVRTVPLRDERGDIVKWYGTSTDIEDRKRAEETSRRAAEELQALSRRLVELQESERKALARELHDRLGETLTALSINLAMLKQAVRGDAAATTRIEDSAALLKSTAATIENMVAELRPPMLDGHGLAAAIDWHAKQFTRRAGVAVSVQAAQLGERIAPEVEMALFRIAQEALNNVAKHARAEHVAITLWRSQSELVMSIADDGIGLPTPAQAPERAGLGLVTMRERAQAVGGVFKVEPLPDGAGTRLIVRIAL